MPLATVSTSRQPLSEINTTPLIDVLLVLLIMIIMTIPVATHSLDVDLPDEGPVRERLHPVKNMLVVTQDDRLLWNGNRIEEGELAALLAQVRGMAPEPTVEFQPDAQASYEASARILLIVEASRISRFGFVGNERYREFARGR